MGGRKAGWPGMNFTEHVVSPRPPEKVEPSVQWPVGALDCVSAVYQPAVLTLCPRTVPQAV